MTQEAENVEIPLRTVVGAVPGPHLLITAGVHGDEFEPMAAVRSLAGRLDAATLRGQATLVPIANESAFARGARCGEDGLDMARTFPGKPDGSATERAAHAVAQLIRGADYYLDLHTGGAALDLLPLAGYMLHRDPAVLAFQRRMARAFDAPVVWGTDWRLEGRSLSTARDAGIPAIYAEHRGGATCRPESVAALADGCLNVMAELGMLSLPATPSRTQHVVEDERPASGHLQVQHLSPRAGFFEAAVSLGDSVSLGDVLGHVSDALGENISLVRAERTGIVLGLRILPRVTRGDALAMILEIP